MNIVHLKPKGSRSTHGTQWDQRHHHNPAVRQSTADAWTAKCPRLTAGGRAGLSIPIKPSTPPPLSNAPRGYHRATHTERPPEQRGVAPPPPRGRVSSRGRKRRNTGSLCLDRPALPRGASRGTHVADVRHPLPLHDGVPQPSTPPPRTQEHMESQPHQHFATPTRAAGLETHAGLPL